MIGKDRPAARADELEEIVYEPDHAYSSDEIDFSKFFEELLIKELYRLADESSKKSNELSRSDDESSEKFLEKVLHNAAPDDGESPESEDWLKKSFKSLFPFAINAFAKQIGGVVKAIVDGMGSGDKEGVYGNIAKYIKNNGGVGKSILNGYQFRLAGNLVSMLPARAVGVSVRTAAAESGMSVAETNAATVILASAVETCLAAPFEAKSIVKALTTAGLAPSLSNVYRASWIAFPGYWMRNSLTWAGALIAPKDRVLDVAERAALGLFCGMISAIPDTIGNMMLKKSLEYGELDLKEAFAKSFLHVIEEFSENPKQFFRQKIAVGAIFRGIPGAIGAVVLSNHGVDAANDIYEGLVSWSAEVKDHLKKIIQQQADIGAGSDAPRPSEEKIDKFLENFSQEFIAHEMAKRASQAAEKDGKFASTLPAPESPSTPLTPPDIPNPFFATSKPFAAKTMGHIPSPAVGVATGSRAGAGFAGFVQEGGGKR